MNTNRLKIPRGFAIDPRPQNIERLLVGKLSQSASPLIPQPHSGVSIEDYLNNHSQDGPYAGDVVWVKETWRPLPMVPHEKAGIQYRYDLQIKPVNDLISPVEWGRINEFDISQAPDKRGRRRAGRWRPPAAMRMYGSRVIVQITRESYKRIMDTTEADAVSRGYFSRDELLADHKHRYAFKYFVTLEDNPWMRVLDFEVKWVWSVGFNGEISEAVKAAHASMTKTYYYASDIDVTAPHVLTAVPYFKDPM